MYRVSRTYTFEAAHSLPLVADDHKCRRVHGHSYRIRVTLESAVLVDGMVVDYAEIDAVVQPMIDSLDHRNINDTIENSTAENLAFWLGDQIRLRFPNMVRSVEVQETDRANAIWLP